jgi:DNA-binding NarL/FixJ family response regulator
MPINDDFSVSDAGIMHDALHKRISFTVLSSFSTLARVYIERLESLGFHHDPDSPQCVLLDIPCSFALRTLETKDPLVTAIRYIIITAGTSSEYFEELWELGAHGILTKDHDEQHLIAMLVNAAQGERYQAVLGDASPLTAKERRIIRLLAEGHDLRVIADRLNYSHQHVRNLTTIIYAKLGIANQREAMLHYWGLND